MFLRISDSELIGRFACERCLNPKQFEDVKTYYALFQGTFDVAAKKWTVMDTRSIDAGAG